MIKSEDIPSVETGIGVNSPEAKVEGSKIVVGRQAINNEDEAWKLYESLRNNQETRNSINAEIALRHTGKRPRNQNQLLQEGRSWQSNFPTGMLAGIIDRIRPNFLNAIESQRFLTQATLPDTIDGQPIADRDKKVEVYRETFTRTVKSWKEWRDFNSALVSELTLIGYGFTIRTDEDTPWPMFFRQDKAWIHEHSPNLSDYLQVLACEQPVLIHELIDKIENESAAEAGWKLENCAEAINKAAPLDTQKEGEPRAYSDLVRESSTAQSFMGGAKSIVLGHLFVTEPKKEKNKGRITHWILDTSTKKPLFTRSRRFDSMSDVCTLFTLEPGNNRFYGSRGVGKMLVNLSIGVDELVNDAVSQMKMAGMMIIKTDAKTGITAQVKVKAPFAVVTTDGEFQKEQFPTDIQGFVSLYEQLTKIAEVSIGAYIPNVLASDPSQGRRTAREATIDYSRELQTGSAYVARFVGQYGIEMGLVQKRLGKKDTTDQDAKDFQAELKERGLSDKEIKILTNSAAVENIQDLSGQESEQKAAVATELQGNPLVDQKKALQARIIARVSPAFAKEIMLSDAEDQTILAEAVRMQKIETEAIMDGTDIPVSPRDPDEIHLGILIPDMKQGIDSFLPLVKEDPSRIDPKMLDGFHRAMFHGEGHVTNMLKKGKKPADLKVEIDFFKWVDKVLMATAKAIQAHQEAAYAALKGQHDIALREQLGMGPGASEPGQNGSEGPGGPAGPEQPAMEPPKAPELPPSKETVRAKVASTINYKDAPEYVRKQMEKDLGYDEPVSTSTVVPPPLPPGV